MLAVTGNDAIADFKYSGSIGKGRCYSASWKLFEDDDITTGNYIQYYYNRVFFYSKNKCFFDNCLEINAKASSNSTTAAIRNGEAIPYKITGIKY